MDISLKNVMSLCKNYLFTNGLDLSLEKSAVHIFTSHILKHENQIILDNDNIPWRKSTEYLRMFLDQKLPWDKYINMILRKAEKDLQV